jgi:Flp pilus assembly protein CpaB
MARSIATAATSSSRNRGVLMLAALFGVLSAALMFAFLSSRGGDDNNLDNALQGGGEMRTVVVLARDVDYGTTITTDMLTRATVPAGAILPGAYEDEALVVGQVTTTRVFAGEQVIPGKITTFEGQNTLAFKVPEGMRALSLEVPHEAWVNAGLPQPGDRIDVLGITTLLTVDPLTGQEKPDIISGVIAQDVMVLAVAQSLVSFVPENTDTTTPAGTDPDAAATPAADTSGEPAYLPLGSEATYETSISVTLALTPELAAKVAIIDAMKDDQGQYRILTRQQGDRAPIDGDTNWTLDDIFQAN